jgi:sulfatase modifying factor 1
VYDLTKWECDWEKNGYRLPTEAEWTYAAKGHAQNEYAWGNDLAGAVCTWNGSKKIFSNGLTPVGFYDGTEKYGMLTTSNVSPFGVFDLTGNVWEWCWDWYGSSYFSASPKDDPRGPQNGDVRLPWSTQATRIWKGGGLLAPDFFLRVNVRWSACCDQCYSELGFRVARRIIP